MSDMRSEAIDEFTAALAKAQGAMHNAPMNRVNPHFKSKYADLAAIVDAIRGPLSSNGLAPTHQTVIRDGALILRTELTHSSGQWRASEYPVPIGTPQQMGSALTYAKRYTLSALVCISADEDDDANAAETTAKRANGKVANGGDKITPDQVKELTELLEAKGRTVEQFCQWREIARMEDLPAARFDSTKAYLVQMGGAK